MADEQRVVRGVSWNEVFSLSHIFKSFKMAIHPSKIILALLAIILTCALGLVMERGLVGRERFIRRHAR